MTEDLVVGNVFVTRYAYHHGYFDGVEREFRGFAMVERFDTEDFAALASDGQLTGANIDAATQVPPTVTRTWFHTGVFVGGEHVSNYFAGLGDATGPGRVLPRARHCATTMPRPPPCCSPTPCCRRG